MAVFAVFWRWLIEQHLLAIHVAEELVAVPAAHIQVPALQGEGRLFMVEQRGFPLGRVVALYAGSNPIGLGELASVNVGMAVLALGRRLGEVGLDELGAEVRRLVAVDAGHRLMRAREDESRPVVIEAGDVLPVLGCVAGFAANGRTIAAQRLHALGELVVVRILMAGGAGIVLKVEDRSRVIAGRTPGIRNFVLHRNRGRQQHGLRKRRGRLMAITADDCQVPSSERETCLLVLSKGERGGLETVDRMALLAPIQPRRRGKLRLVLVMMAVQAAGELDAIQRVLALGNVATRTFHFGVLAFQRILRGRVRLHIKF